MRKYQVWTSEEDDYLKTNYKNMTLDELAEAIGRSRGSVTNRLTRLNVFKRKAPKWAGCPDTIADCLKCIYPDCTKPGHLLSEENRGYGYE